MFKVHGTDNKSNLPIMSDSSRSGRIAKPIKKRTRQIGNHINNNSEKAEELS